MSINNRCCQKIQLICFSRFLATLLNHIVRRRFLVGSITARLPRGIILAVAADPPHGVVQAGIFFLPPQLPLIPSAPPLTHGQHPSVGVAYAHVRIERQRQRGAFAIQQKPEGVGPGQVGAHRRPPLLQCLARVDGQGVNDGDPKEEASCKEASCDGRGAGLQWPANHGASI